MPEKYGSRNGSKAKENSEIKIYEGTSLGTKKEAFSDFLGS